MAEFGPESAQGVGLDAEPQNIWRQSPNHGPKRGDRVQRSSFSSKKPPKRPVNQARPAKQGLFCVGLRSPQRSQLLDTPGMGGSWSDTQPGLAHPGFPQQLAQQAASNGGAAHRHQPLPQPSLPLPALRQPAGSSAGSDSQSKHQPERTEGPGHPCHDHSPTPGRCACPNAAVFGA